MANDACSQGDNCLAILGGGLELSTVGAGRGADLASFDSAKLSFKMNVVVDDLLGITDAVLSVAASDGSGWDTVGPYLLALSQESEETITVDDAYLTHDFKLRFTVSGLLAGDV